MLLDLPGYETAEAYTGEFERLPVGGYVCCVIRAKVEPWANGNGRSLVLALDVCEGEYEGIYTKQFDSDARTDKKWPCMFRQTIPEAAGSKAMGWFKGMIEAIEGSNLGFKWDRDTESLKGKLVGVLFGREEYFSVAARAGRWMVKPVRVSCAEKIRSGDFKIPADRPMAGGAGELAGPPLLDDDGCPF